MTDDLVARLRVFAAFDPDQAEAADEIERLRALVRDNGTPRFNAVCKRAEKAEAEIKRLRAALHRINGLNDHPARFSPDIDAVIEAALAGEKTNDAAP